jgi:hypothetical protein
MLLPRLMTLVDMQLFCNTSQLVRTTNLAATLALKVTMQNEYHSYAPSEQTFPTICQGFSYKKPIIGRQVPRKIICSNANYSCQEVWPFLHSPSPPFSIPM